MIVLHYGGAAYELTVEGERELRALVEGGKAGWFGLLRGGESVDLWISPFIPLSIVTTP
ncbi:Uncharacterised protein [Mycobacteroides abscessus subsp. abscessus]|nr:Uncharacterised protein [Mycobacteroides abscessus subsp. abscessus]SIJ04190.1 Uncharacterised protein [Mycobacteroides abscessus subsp. abscessus]SIK09599.1 Uncharacterised protein [Mycobacteroides abscessus subsp. abscessus]SIK14235.1 Uncharacterised protein [Mycobacteroides abscessus subsp. abscessus]SIM17140.1 Uncharacterised protein [Mycobacteroides abscessus subsp. abscessus]